MAVYVFDQRANESADGVRTTFTLDLSISDTTKVVARYGNPLVDASLVTSVPGAGEFRVDDTETVTFGTAPGTGGDPLFGYLTNDVTFPTPASPFSGTPIPEGSNVYYVLMERPVESADGSRTSFTVTKRIADYERIQAWYNNPATLAELVTAAPGNNQVRVTSDFTVEFGQAPTFLPFFNYLTDERQNQFGLVFEEELQATANPLVWTYEKIPDNVDKFMLIVGRPGTVYQRVDSSPTFSQYVNNATAKTVTFAQYSEPRPGDPAPRATYYSAAANTVAPC